MVCQTIALTKAHSVTYPGYVRCVMICRNLYNVFLLFIQSECIESKCGD